ncbi:hypothetical protein [Streptomyces sp. NPDC018833]|uniref:hypothetical protein n=1 Tax=Streptomyces sp. NPDC018833 TaxID=3365053 RepID=UPI0037B7AAEF
MDRHHHGYTWLGSGFDLHRDGPRREVHPEFRASPLPPLEVAQWLLKPEHFVRGTWTDPGEAAGWYGTQVRAHTNAFTDRHERDVVEQRLAAVRARLTDGQDVVGGWWLTGQRFLSVCLVACSPHRLRGDLPCPQILS